MNVSYTMCNNCSTVEEGIYKVCLSCQSEDVEYMKDNE